MMSKFLPLKGIQDRLGLWTPSCGFRISGTEFQYLYKKTWILGPVSRKARKLSGPEGKFENQNLLNSTTVPSSQTGQYCFVN